MSSYTFSFMQRNRGDIRKMCTMSGDDHAEALLKARSLYPSGVWELRDSWKNSWKEETQRA